MKIVRITEYCSILLLSIAMAGTIWIVVYICVGYDLADSIRWLRDVFGAGIRLLFR